MRFKKGSKEAKAFMAKLRAKRATKSKVKPKPSRIDDLLLLDEIKARQKKVGAVSKNKGIRAKKAYNKDVDAYKYFVVNNGKVESGFEYKNDALDVATDFDNAKVLNLIQLKQQGFEDPRNKWKYAIGSKLKLTPKETRLGATEKDFKPKSKSYHKDTKSHNVNIRVISGFNELTAKQKTLYNKLYNSYNKSGLYKIVNFEKYVMQNIVIAEAKRKSTIDLYKIYDFVQNDY